MSAPTFDDPEILFDDVRFDFDGSHAGDMVNVWEQATLVGQGPATFAALAKNK